MLKSGKNWVISGKNWGKQGKIREKKVKIFYTTSKKH